MKQEQPNPSLASPSCSRKELEDAINIVRDELREAGISNMVDGPEKVAKCIDRASRNFHTVAEALGYDWLSGKISSAND